MEEPYHQHGGRYLAQICHTISVEEVHDQYSGGHAVWTCHIINTEEIMFNTPNCRVCSARSDCF